MLKCGTDPIVKRSNTEQDILDWGCEKAIIRRGSTKGSTK